VHVQHLRDAAVLAPLHLQSIDWQLNVGTASSNGARTQKPHSVLQLELAQPLPPQATNDASPAAVATTPVHMQFDAAQMQGLLDKLDTIQGQMDRLI